MNKHLKTLAAGAALAAFGLTAQANIISASVSVDAGAVEYWAFDYLDLLPGGGVRTFTVGTTAAVTEDPHLCVFAGSLAAGNLVGCDDDGAGSGFNASLSFNTTFLSAGTFIIALSGFNLTVAEALAGTNPGSSAFASTLNVQGGAFLDNPYVSNLRQVNAVPEPGTLALVGLALAGLGLRRKVTK